MATIAQTLELSPELYQRLEILASRQNRLVADVLLEAIEEYLDGEWDGEDDDARIKAEFMEGWHQAMTHPRGRPIWDILHEMEADDSST